MPPKENEVELSELIALEEQIEDLKDALYDARVLLKSAIPIPKGATNGDMIKAMFPNLEIVDNGFHNITVIFGDYRNQMYRNHYDEDWWNAPYEVKE